MGEMQAHGLSQVDAAIPTDRARRTKLRSLSIIDYFDAPAQSP